MDTPRVTQSLVTPRGPGARFVGVKSQNLVIVTAGGDWTTQESDPSALIEVLGPGALAQKAAEGDRDAQFSLGYMWASSAPAAAAGELDAAGRSPYAKVGLDFAPLLGTNFSTSAD